MIGLSTPAFALNDLQIQAACYTDCDKETNSNGDLKACLARAADTADGVLNHDFTSLLDAIKKQATDMSMPPDAQLGKLKDAQQSWTAFRDAACDFEDSLAFGASATGGLHSSCVCALTYGRINDFERIRHSVLGQ
jgi:uncharacterized protein YecT (DUF1311 family)